MSRTRLTWDTIEQPRECRTGERHTFVIEARRAHVLEVDDVHFNHDSAVFLPQFENGSPGSPPDLPPDGIDRHDGIALLAACFHHASEHPERKLLITGHTDTTGSAGYNSALAQLRADNVLHALTGARNEWVVIAAEKHRVLDYQQILAWISRVWFWDCDPGPLDDDSGSLTKDALAGFQHRYNQDFGGSIGVDGDIGPETWGAFFDAYMRMLADLLDTDEAGLERARQKLSFLDGLPKAVGCGEHFPVEETRKNNYRSLTNRRVEILFFDPGEEPELACHASPGECSPGACRLYAPEGFYRFRHLPVRPYHPDELLPQVYLLDARGERVPGALWRASRDGALLAEGTADDSGLATLPSMQLPDTIDLEWTVPDQGAEPGAIFPFSREYFVRVPIRDRRNAGRRMLSNLGFNRVGGDRADVIEFQRALGIPVTGKLKDILDPLVQWHETGDRPAESTDPAEDEDLPDVLEIGEGEVEGED
jgi:hypothetical protein